MTNTAPANQDPNISNNPSPHATNEPTRSRKVSTEQRSRKVSRVSIADGPHGHDNPGYESPSRKISEVSEHTEIGPVRKKSILHKNSERDLDTTSVSQGSEITKYVNGEPRSRKISNVDSIHSTRTKISDEDEKSWWFGLCLKCRSKDDNLPSWSPKFWPRVCPYPYCPTYRQFSRIIGISLIGLLLWCLLYSIIGSSAAPPNGKLFQLILLSIAAHFGGWLMSLTTLPPLIGMLLTGILLQNVNIVNIDNSFTGINKELRNVALVIILTRAGLDLDPNALRRLWLSVLKIGLGPWTVEAIVTMIMSVFLLGLPWSYGALLGSIVAAVSPAVIVPCLFRLRTKGYGVVKGIPTLIIAISGIDDAASVAGFGIIKSIIFSNASIAMLVIEAPLTIAGGLGFGFVWGLMCSFIPEKNDPFVVPLRILLLLIGGLTSVFGSELIGFGGAGPLACVALAFSSLYFWSKQGWEIEENPAATAFEIFWMIFEPILFGITGASVKFNEIEPNTFWLCIGILVTAIIIRLISTIFLGIGCHLNSKEKFFVSIACMAKATVQAALGPAVLGLVPVDSVEHQYGEKMLNVCVLSIILTAPTGAILITILGPRLLTKMKTTVPEGWRRSHRPSIRDISIIDEMEERDIEDFKDNASYKSTPEHPTKHVV